MLNKLLDGIRQHKLVQPGDRIVCAVSGGADSIAMLFAFYLLKERLDITLEAAHFNHGLRGAESDADEAFVRDFCQGYRIPLSVGSGNVIPGKKGLEAAARDARYGFLNSLPGKIATAHTADDNAETVLMHLVRGTGLKGLGGIAPVNGKLIRPMLTITRQDVLAFLEEYSLPHREDSSNATDDFLRNRLRHHVMPLLSRENPRLSENLSAMAQRLRLDEDALSQLSQTGKPLSVTALKAMHPALQNRALERFLKESGVKEPEAAHLQLARALIDSDNPSTRAAFPGGITIGRQYNQLIVLPDAQTFSPVVLPETGSVEIPELDLTIICSPASKVENTPDTFTFVSTGPAVLRPRLPGDEIRLNAGTKSLKKLFIDRKIPAMQRSSIPVLADEAGLIGVMGIGIHLDRIPAALPARQVRIIKNKK